MFTYQPKGGTFAGGEPMLSFHLNFEQGYDVTYQWDATRAGWLRFQRTNEPFMAAGLVPTQVAPTNVIVQFVAYGGAGEGELYGGGEAWIFSNGQLVRGTWERAFPEAPTVFKDALGNPIALTPGRTWVELFPLGQSVDLVPAPLPPPTAAPATTPTTSAKKKP
jgi:hypothetical protein